MGVAARRELAASGSCLRQEFVCCRVLFAAGFGRVCRPEVGFRWVARAASGEPRIRISSVVCVGAGADCAQVGIVRTASNGRIVRLVFPGSHRPGGRPGRYHCSGARSGRPGTVAGFAKRAGPARSPGHDAVRSTVQPGLRCGRCRRKRGGGGACPSRRRARSEGSPLSRSSVRRADGTFRNCRPFGSDLVFFGRRSVGRGHGRAAALNRRAEKTNNRVRNMNWNFCAKGEIEQPAVAFGLALLGQWRYF